MAPKVTFFEQWWFFIVGVVVMACTLSRYSHIERTEEDDNQRWDAPAVNSEIMNFQMTDILWKLKGCNESDESIYPIYLKNIL